MGLYGPSASTGLTGGAAAFAMTNSPMFAFLAGFTMIGAALATARILPAFRRRGKRGKA